MLSCFLEYLMVLSVFFQPARDSYKISNRTNKHKQTKCKQTEKQNRYQINLLERFGMRSVIFFMPTFFYWDLIFLIHQEEYVRFGWFFFIHNIYWAIK